MNDDLLFELDTSGSADNQNHKPLRYSSSGYLDDVVTEEDGTSKPSQERPAILKMKTKRYHQLKDDNKFVPGSLSNELLKALGLRKHDIPEHIYRMRQLGYPPGWLKKCEVTKNESLRIIGADSVIMNDSSDDGVVKYDCDLLYEYPGFNSFIDYDPRYDYYRERGFSPLQKECLIANFRKKLENLQMVGKEATDIREMRLADSDTGNDFNLPKSFNKRPMATSTPQKNAKISKYDTHAELSEGEISDEEESDRDMKAPSRSSSLIHLDTSSVTADTSGNGVVGDVGDLDERVVHDGDGERGTHNNHSESDGTAILIDSYRKPSLDNFSQGIGEHRLFENLPNSKGVYKKMRDVLMKSKKKDE